MNCLYCQKELKANPYYPTANPNINLFWNKHCPTCNTDYCLERPTGQEERMHAVRIIFQFKGVRNDLSMDLEMKTATIFLDAQVIGDKDVNLPWDVALKLTPQNIQKKLPTILTFL